MPVEILYSVIGVLIMAVLTLGGLWVRAQDTFRQWATAEFVELAKDVAAMKLVFEEIRSDIQRLEGKLETHMREEMALQREMLARLRGEKP